MKENKKLETTNTEIVAQTPLTQITDNRREITELTDAEIKEIEKNLNNMINVCGGIWSSFKNSNI